MEKKFGYIRIPSISAHDDLKVYTESLVLGFILSNFTDWKTLERKPYVKWYKKTLQDMMGINRGKLDEILENLENKGYLKSKSIPNRGTYFKLLYKGVELYETIYKPSILKRKPNQRRVRDDIRHR